MPDAAAKPTTIDAYIAAAPESVRPILAKLRETIRAAAPAATEKISYGMPAFVLDGDLVYFGAFKRHIGFFPPVRDPALVEATRQWQGEKGNLKFPLDEPMPYALIARLVRARVHENRERAARRRDAKSARRRPAGDDST